MTDAPPHIGTLREKPLHASLKEWYSEAGDRIESPVAGYVIDLVRGDLLIEIQTGGFSSMKRKLASLLDVGHQVRIVHPIPIDKWIVKVDTDGTILSRRRSPKHGRPTDIFAEMVSFPELLAEPTLGVEILMTKEEEYRTHTPGKAWRRNGWTVMERRLLDVVDSFVIHNTNDLAALVPEGLPEAFTTADLADALGGTRRNAQQMAYCLRNCGVFEIVGKQGRSLEYRVC